MITIVCIERILNTPGQVCSCCLSKAFIVLILIGALSACGNGSDNKNPETPGGQIPTPTPSPGRPTQVDAFSDGAKIFDQTEHYNIALSYNPETTTVIYDSDTMHLEVSP